MRGYSFGQPLRGSWRIRTAVHGFADRWLSHSSNEPFCLSECKVKTNICICQIFALKNLQTYAWNDVTSWNIMRYFNKSIMSSTESCFCSPDDIHFRVIVLFSISVSPTIATYGISPSLAKPICFFILADSGYSSQAMPAFRSCLMCFNDADASASPKLTKSIVEPLWVSAG